MPSSACAIRRWPSNENGFVTTPTVRMPLSLAALAMIGAAPVPVPPPIPAVINTILQSFSSARTSSMLSSAASFPISGLDPAPNPWVISEPSCIFRGARECDSD